MIKGKERGERRNTANRSIVISEAKRIAAILVIAHTCDLGDGLDDNHGKYAREMLNRLHLFQIEIEDLLEHCGVKSECDLMIQISTSSQLEREIRRKGRDTDIRAYCTDLSPRPAISNCALSKCCMLVSHP